QQEEQQQQQGGESFSRREKAGQQSSSQEQRQQQKGGKSSYQHDQKARQENSANIFSGFDTETLAQAFGVSTETASKLKGENDQRGGIVNVEKELRMIMPTSSEEDEEYEQEQQMGANGVEEAICNMRFRQNIEKPKHADFYSPYGGRVTILNSQNLPILQTLQLSAERGTLYQNAMLSPHWNINAHGIIYVLSGDARVQVVDNSGQTVYNGQLR
ncbi:PREDICTED: 11S globulin seed storage protein G3-like, partial [Nelumbo nucifera]